jgi:hypothetical protein
LTKYAGSAGFIGCATGSDSWLLAPDFCSDAERSRNITDAQGFDKIWWQGGVHRVRHYF